MKSIRICLTAAILGAIISFSSCSKKSENPTPTVKFTTHQASYGEDQGTQGIGITLSAKQSQDVTVSYTWTSPDTTAFLGANFTFASSSTITIPAGSTTGTININLIDDTQIDGDNDLTLTLTSTALKGAVLPAASDTTDLKFNLTITDNDAAQDGQLQVDLYWFGTNPFANINNNTLYVIFQQGVVYHDTSTVDGDYPILDDQGTPLHAFNATTPGYLASGFQTAYLKLTDPDQKYFIYVPYVKGTGEVTFIMVFNGLSLTNEFIGPASFSAADAPSSQGDLFYYFGPFLKSGGIFSQTSRTSGIKQNLKLIKSQHMRWHE